MLGFDLVVIVRRQKCPEIMQLIEFAKAHAIPVICDLDDFLFDEEAIAHSEYLRSQPDHIARAFIDDWRELIAACGRYTGATPFLCDRASSLARAYLIPNGLSLAQMKLSRLAQVDTAQSPQRATLFDLVTSAVP